MDGMSMLAKLRQDDWGTKAKVILLTNLGDKDKIAESVEQGASDYLVKSDWSLEEVVEKVKEKLK